MSKTLLAIIIAVSVVGVSAVIIAIANSNSNEKPTVVSEESLSSLDDKVVSEENTSKMLVADSNEKFPDSDKSFSSESNSIVPDEQNSSIISDNDMPNESETEILDTIDDNEPSSNNSSSVSISKGVGEPEKEITEEPYVDTSENSDANNDTSETANDIPNSNEDSNVTINRDDSSNLTEEQIYWNNVKNTISYEEFSDLNPASRKALLNTFDSPAEYVKWLDAKMKGKVIVQDVGDSKQVELKETQEQVQSSTNN